MTTLGPDKAFVTSLQGMLRIAEIVFGVCGIICIESIGTTCYETYVHRYEFALFVLIVSFLLALFFVVVFVLRSQELMSSLVNFPFLLLVCDSFSGLFYLIVCLLEFCAYCQDPNDNAATKVAGVFGLFAMICFFISSYFSYKFFRDERFPTSFAPPHPGLHAVSVTPSMG
ncbi:CKLF-like MARVEL transmembrane domain-containing protein 3 [Galendromus occidentalis]|uniref:CKLF-like MARVEL transmembrane domain-containing protein 3 n=1 Tax=Galendromus occidentalis TaxID=34638 RepID=A0AAJ6QU71_9ACAR|nr:CKLF-like MARVEL transmembrane domain-containing protein 3 [Galendromus occidentalis]